MDKKINFLENDKWGLKTLLLVIGGVMLLLSQLVASLIVDVTYMIFKIESSSLLFAMRGILEMLLFYIVISIYVRKILKLDLSFFRIIKPKLDLLWVFVAMVLPIYVITFYLLFLNGKISYGNEYTLISNIAFVLKMALVSGITEELLFRGYIMKIVEYRWNKTVAIIMPSIIFASLHAIKGMNVGDFFQLLIAGTIVGIMFSLIAYQGDNVGTAVIVHTMWNLLVIGVFNISVGDNLKSIINYRFESENVLLTGGQFGIEASMPAIIGYLIVIILTIIRRIKKPVNLAEARVSVKNNV
ncbi:MAG: CPBP family intramembrane metalloprotease [Clostridiales bacterium]|nr:CPBP family intramembrane metalloprotease [Clostridiales bacterium]